MNKDFDTSEKSSSKMKQVSEAQLIYEITNGGEYTWNPIFDTTTCIFDDNYVSKNLYTIILDKLRILKRKLGDRILNFLKIVSKNAYLFDQNFFKLDQSYEHLRDQDTDIIAFNKIAESISKKYTNSTKPNIVQRYFDQPVDLRLFMIWKYLKTVSKNSASLKFGKTMIISKNTFITRGVIYIKKYVEKDYRPSDVDVIIYSYQTNVLKKTYDFFKKENISHTVIEKPLSNEHIDALVKQQNGYDTIIVDINILIGDLRNARTNYTFPTILAFMIFALETIKAGGTILLYRTISTNSLLIDFLRFLAAYFDMSFVSHTFGMCFDIDIPFYFTVLHGYKSPNKQVDTRLLRDLNAQLLEIDPTGGYQFDHLCEHDTALIFEYIPKHSLTKYLTSVAQSRDSNNSDALDHKKFTTQILEDFIETMHNIDLLGSNFEQNLEIITTRNFFSSVRLALEYDIPLVPWLNVSQRDYLDTMIRNLITQVPFLYINRMIPSPKDVKIGLHNDINFKYYEYLTTIYYTSDGVYQAVENVNYRSYKGVELFINSLQKELNDTLYEKHNVNINDRVVSRAWTKMYEILTETRFLENISLLLALDPETPKAIRGFHICEAPGNFINSIIYYIQKNVPQYTYDWHSQSLAPGKADFFDSYGFIKSTKDRWDLGVDGSGDITKYENARYYHKKYQGVHILVSDCGEKWEPPSDGDYSKDLSVYQLLYVLLFPKIGGNFIIKTFHSNINKQYLALLFVLLACYDKVFLTKSNMNFWSPEMYIVGIGFKGLSEEQQNNVWTIFENLNKGIVTYPVNYISTPFTKYYEGIVQNIGTMSTNAKHFFVWAAQYQEFYNNNKPLIAKAIRAKNKLWLEKYFPPALKN